MAPSIRISRIIGAAVGTTMLGLGINVLLAPDDIIALFGWTPPRLPADRELYLNIMKIYALRNMWGGCIIGLISYFGEKKLIGTTLLAVAALAIGDGSLCYENGNAWNHWAFAPAGAIPGLWILS